MYELFEFVRLLSVRRQSTRQGPVEVTRFTWREDGECSLLALLCSNDQLLLRLGVSGRAPVVKQLPWPHDKRVAAMCFDPTVSWLLIVTESPCLYIVPARALMDPAALVNQLWSLSDCTVIPVATHNTLCAACWWHTLDDRQVAIVATKVGELFFVDLLTREVKTKITIDIQVNQLILSHDDDQMSTSLLMTGVSSGQWKMLLEARTVISHFSHDSDISDMGYIDIDTHTVPPQSVLDCSAENVAVFTAERIPQSQPWVVLHPQFARGRHFITAHDQKAATLQVYDSEIQFSPLFIYKLPPGAENVILTDRVTFTLSRRNGCQLLVLSNQRAETSAETLQDFNDDAVIQKLELPPGEKLLGACQRSFPFYWHDKQEEQQRARLRQGTVLEQPTMDTVAMDPQAFEIPVTSHTVLDGCIIVTDTAVYECRPRASPERLFLQHTMVSGETGLAEHLAISVGLDITLLAELAAQHLLGQGQVSRAVRLYSISKPKPGRKCSHLKRVAHLAGQGCIGEMVVMLRQALHNAGSELSSMERRVLADMLLHCYVHQVAHHAHGITQTVTAFREFLLGSFSFDESTALDLLAEYGLTILLLEFAMGRGLVADALERLVVKDQLPVALTLLTQLVTRGFSAHVLQAAQGGVLSSLRGEAVMQVLVTNPQLVVRHIALVKYHLASLDLPLLLQLASILDPSQGAVRSLMLRQGSSLHRASSLTSVASLSSFIGDMTDQDNVVSLSQVLEVFVLIVLHIHCRRGNQLPWTADLLLSDPTLKPETQGVEEGKREERERQQLALQFQPASCGSYHAAVIRDGELYTWGRTSHGRLGHGDLMGEGVVSGAVCVPTFHMLHIRVEAVACGGEHTLAITQQGVYGWGNSRYGQVGVGTRHIYHRPMLVETLLPHTCVAVHCGQYHSLVITADCRVWSWGWGVHGQLGHGDPEDQLSPRCIQRLVGRNIVRAAAGYCHSLVLSELGELWSFGCGYFGQLGIGSTQKQTSPVLVRGISEPVTVIGTKYFHNVAATVSGRVYTWGCHPHNLRYAANALRRTRQMGQLSAPMGDGMEMFHLPLTVDTTYLRSRVVQVSCGSLHTCLLTVEGEVYVWGRNLEYQLGTGIRQDERIPKMLTRINDQHVIHLSTGAEFNIALDSDFTVWVWGKNDSGQLGLTPDVSKPGGGGGPLQHKPQSSLSMLEVCVPTTHRGLPPINPLAHSRWGSGSPQLPSAAVQTLQWVEEGGGGDNFPLPSLLSVCPSDLPYHTNVITLLVKHLGDLMDSTVVQQHCVDLGDYLTAAHLCMLDNRHGQALCYKLLALTKARHHLPADSMADLSTQVISSHLNLALCGDRRASLGDQTLSTLCREQMVNHWLEHQLSMSKLQKLLEPHLSHLAPHLATLLFRCQTPATRSGPGGEFYCQHFDSSFCLRVVSAVLTDNTPPSQQFLTTWLPEHAHTHAGEGGASRGEVKKTAVLQPRSHLIPYQRVWQDIVRSVSKSSPSTIPLTRSQLDHLHVHTTEAQEEGDDSDGGEPGTVVLFTCGHHFTQVAFTQVVLATSLQQLGSGSGSGSLSLVGGSCKLPATASLLQQYYSRSGLLPLACPKCVLNVLTAL
ncbi:uncharacterized protein LOC143299801 isoform X3 [Babylonia areolata]|uniref:uncharacterized protein LOC143299801 isoform X3 n=1 Tax=Babylonia areolata TaxID=304850 RepID=UPI003FCEF846